jgi:hypothetical protein
MGFKMKMELFNKANGKDLMNEERKKRKEKVEKS